MSFFGLMNLLDYSYDDLTTSWSSSRLNEIKQRCDPSIVVISLVHVRKVGIEGATSIAKATGFVVDAENGLILTNRHVIKNGPVIASAKFVRRRKQENVKLTPLYRDPVHDFGFFRFDPSQLQLDVQPLDAIPLCPEKAVKDARVLIVGCQRGRLEYHENVKLLDVHVNPVSGMDFNTFMITGDDNTRPGYSGGPILNAKGEAIAMVSTTLKETNLSYHVPVDRCKYTLDCLAAGLPVPRGTLQAVFVYKEGEVVQGLKNANEQVAAFFREHQEQKSNEEQDEDAEEREGSSEQAVLITDGLLQMDKALAGGPGATAGLQKGDWLLSIDESPVFDFVGLEAILDAAVGSTVELVMLRDDQLVRVQADVQNFHELDASEYIEVSNGILHNVEFITAVVYNLPMEGVFVAQAGYMFKDVVPEMSIITRIGDKPTRDLDEFQQAIDGYTNGSLVRVQYYLPSDPERVNFRMLQIEKQWFPYQRGYQDPTSGEWQLTDCSRNGQAQREGVAETRVSIYTTLTYDSEGLADSFHPRVMSSVRKERGFFGSAFRGLSMSFTGSHGKFREVHNAIVSIKFTTPFEMDSHQQDEESKGRCVGVVVDKELGLIVTERFTVFTTLGDALVTFNSIASIAARVVFVHPFHFFSILKYDPNDLTAHDMVKVSSIPLSDSRVQIGESVLYAGLSIKFTRSLEPQATVGSRESLFLSGTPRNEGFNPRNLEYFQGTERASGMGGVYIHPEDFTLRGLNVHFIRFRIQAGIQAADIHPYYHLVRDALLQKTRPPKHIPLLGLHVNTKPLVEILNTCNLSKEWTKRLYNSMDPAQHNVLVVSKRMLFTNVYEHLRNQDVILAVNGNVTTNLTEYNRQIMGCNEVSLTVIREGEVITVSNVRTTRLSAVGTTRLVFIAGLTVQELAPSAYFALDSRDEGISPTSVYISSVAEGSPGMVAKCRKSSVILEVDGIQIASLDDFLDEVVQIPNGAPLTMKLLEIESAAVYTKTILLDTDYWHTRELARNHRTFLWRTSEIDHNTAD